jgi:TPR repeat protein
MNALGVLYLRGHIKAKNQREMAVSWFKFSARHGNATAIKNLNLISEPIPPADLIHRKTRSEIEAESRAMDAWGGAASTLGEVLGRSLF